MLTLDNMQDLKFRKDSNINKALNDPVLFLINKEHIFSWRKGTLGCLFHKYPKSYINVSYSLALGPLLNFDWLVHLDECERF